MPIFRLVPWLVIIAAVLTGLAVAGRAASPKPRPGPAPRFQDQRGRKGLHPVAIFAVVLGTLVLLAVVLVVGPYVVGIGIMWVGCRGSSGGC